MKLKKMIEFTEKYLLQLVKDIIFENPLTEDEIEKLRMVYNMHFLKPGGPSVGGDNIFILEDEKQILSKTENLIIHMHGRFMIGRKNRERENNEKKSTTHNLNQFMSNYQNPN